MKKIIDSKGRLFGKISVIDIAVIIVVLFLCAAVYMRFFVLETTSKTADTNTIRYSVMAYSLRDCMVDNIKVGDDLYEAVGNTYVGKITNIEKTESKSWNTKEDGTYALGTLEDRYDLIIDVEADGIITDGRYFVNRTYEISANIEKEFYTKYCQIELVIMEIK